jgi:ribosome-associated heat shock protein Hsp15
LRPANEEMTVPETVRIDKWLWAVRVYRTRTLAADACRQGKVTIAGQAVKPSRDIRINDVIVAKTGTITRTVRALKLLEQRVGAQAAKESAEDLTPAEEYEKPKEPMLQPLFQRLRGAGRPTKKERRQIAKFGGNW